jgi:hypothetical protein
MERALDRALQEAEKRGLNALEVRQVTLHQDSGLDYISIVARGRTIRRERLLGPVGPGHELCVFAHRGRREFDGRELLTGNNRRQRERR